MQFNIALEYTHQPLKLFFNVFFVLPVLLPVYANDAEYSAPATVIAAEHNILEKESVTPPIFHRIAKSNSVPASLMYAIVLAESQSYINEIGSTKPWPWTVNHAGEAHYFQTKIDAVIFVRSLLNDNKTNFDVGLGQLSWKFHGQKFASIADAFDPVTNLSAAAKFLRRQFERQQCEGWKGAIGCYHRPNQTENHHRYRARKYTERVLRIWQNLEKKGK